MDFTKTGKMVHINSSKNPETNRCTTVPYHCKDLKKGTEQKILKGMQGLNKSLAPVEQ